MRLAAALCQQRSFVMNDKRTAHCVAVQHRTLHPRRRNRRPVTPHVVQINRGRHHFDIVHTELRRLRQQDTVDGNESTAVKVQAPPVAAPLVGVTVNAAALARRLLDGQIQPHVEFAQFVVRAGTVSDQVDALQGEFNVGGGRRPQFFAALATDRQTGILPKLERLRAKGCRALVAGQLGLHKGREDHGFVAVGVVATSTTTTALIGREPPRFAVVAIVGERQLGPHQQNAAIQRQHAAVVADARVVAGHAKIAQHFVRGPALEQFHQTLPGVRHRVGLVKVIFAAVAGDFEFRSEAVDGARGLGLATGLPDALRDCRQSPWPTD